tara:strand:+ start:122 stop:361 length:240 start_codon:yes stop_codon:yes gene_type:complete
MKQLVSFKLCIPNELNTFTITDNIVRARDALSAAKKFYRTHKNLLNIFVLNTDTNEIYQYETKHFFTKKKEHLIKRKKN